jgi:hypothetical protein
MIYYKQDARAKEIIDRWNTNKEFSTKDLAYLMQIQNIEGLVYSGYTPSFNDGDVCEHCTLFIGEINTVDTYRDKFYYINNKGELKEIDGDNWEIEDVALLDTNLSELKVQAISKWLITGNVSKVLQSNYSIEGFEKYFKEVCNFLIKTNTTALFKLVGEDIVFSFTSVDYDEY